MKQNFKISLFSFFIFSFFIFDLAHAKIVTKPVTYEEGSVVLEGFLAYDDSAKPGNQPGVVIVHDWMGLGDYAKSRATQMAELGYVVFAADIYGRGVRPQSQEAAASEAGKYKGDRKKLRARAQAAVDKLKSLKLADPNKLVAMGYCFGGTTVLELARSGSSDVKAVVTFHGGLDSPTPADGKNIKAKLLILHGADDPYVPAKDVAAFQQELRDANVDWQMIYYSGAVHSFSDPKAGSDNSKGAAYNASADKRSFQAMKTFFADTLGLETSASAPAKK
ncbi:MAG: dienelactone hydrolase family protein [Deltaproteobacteria bacterium]|nr:dienelactone hydrolase family protein [Deltaproteobacteria bacterium]